MSVPAGWSADPYGRYAQRYWDGETWTAQVVGADGGQLIDPMGTSMFVPFAMPATAVSASGGNSGGVKQALFGPGGTNGFLDSLGDQGRHRQDPTLRGAFGALGGLILGGGIAALALGDDSNRFVAAIVGLLLIAGAVVARLKAPRKAIDVLAGSVTLLTIGIVLEAVAIASSSSAWLGVIGGLLGIAAWIAPPFRGHPFLLGAGTYGIVFGLGTAIGNAAASDDSFGAEDDLGISLFGLDGAARNTGLFFLFVALVVAFVVYKLDRSGHHGVSTPLLVTAMLSSLTGVVYFGLAINNSGGYLVATVVGAVLAFVGSKGSHRATLWFGAAMATGGFAAFVYALIKPGGTRSSGVIALVLGVVIMLGPRIMPRRSAKDATLEPTD